MVILPELKSLYYYIILFLLVLQKLNTSFEIKRQLKEFIYKNSV